MANDENDVVIPVVAEEAHADAVPVQTGGVRVTKHVEGHDEVVEQELRKGRVEIKRVKTNRVVDGPQPIQRTGNTVIVPVVTEILKIEKQWVVTEEIHLTQVEETETVQQRVRVNREEAEIERLDEQDNAVETIDEPLQNESARTVPNSLVGRIEQKAPGKTGAKRRVLAGGRSLIGNAKNELDRPKR